MPLSFSQKKKKKKGQGVLSSPVFTHPHCSTDVNVNVDAVFSATTEYYYTGSRVLSSRSPVPVYGPRCFERRTPNAERKEHDLFPFRPKPRAKYRQIKAPPFQIRRYAYSNICNVIRRKRKKFCMIYAPTYVHVDRQTCILIFPSIGKKNQCE